MKPTFQTTVFTVLCIFFACDLSAQDTKLQDQSKPFDLSQLIFDCNQFQDPYPPHLVGQFIYKADGNDNGVLEPLEDFTVKFTITNRGNGTASCIEIFATDSASEYRNNAVIDFGKVKKIAYLRPDQTDTVEINLRPNLNLDSARRRVTIHVNEHFKYDMQPLDLGIVSWSYQPKLKYLGYELKEVNSIKVDNALQAGEVVEVKLIIQNQSHSKAFRPTYKVVSDNENIYLGTKDNYRGSFSHSGEFSALHSYGLDTITFTLSPTPRFRPNGSEYLPIYLTLSDSLNKSNIYRENIGIELNQAPRKVETIAWKPPVEQNVIAGTGADWSVDTLNVKNVVPTDALNPDAVAIIMGVENYDYIPKAPYAAQDAYLMKKYFSDVLGIPDNKTIIATNEQVNSKFFDNTFNTTYGSIKRLITKNKTDLYVFYSGHGIPSKDNKSAYLFPSDGRMERLEIDGYNLNSFYNNLNALGARSVTVFVDACFSGSGRTTSKYRDNSLTGEKGVRIVKPEIDGPWETNPNFTVFTSSNYEETSLGVDAVQTGLFTYFLAGGLKGKADTNNDKKITAFELGRYIQSNVSEVSPVLYGKQTPQYIGQGLTEKIILEY